MSSLPIDAILINRPERQRRNLPNIEELASSISRAGLIHPPVVTRDNTLVAGERRITACRFLGWTSIPVTYTDELDPSTLALIELEENVARVDIHWRDKVDAIMQYNTLRRGEPGWNDSQLAKALNIAPSQVLRIKRVADELTRNNMKVRDADSFSVASNMAQRAHERRIADEQHAALAPARPKAEPRPKQTDIKELIDEQPEGGPEHNESSDNHGPILNADFTEWAETYSGPPFNFLHCDFPYGVNADKRKQGSSVHKHGAYDDSPETYWTLLGTLAEFSRHHILPSAHIMFWFSMDYYTETQGFFARYLPDWNIQPFPIYWSKSDNVGLLPDPSRGPRRVVETALIGSRGDRKIVQAVANHFAHPTDRTSGHMSVKPEPMLQHFFRMFVDEHTSMLDPTCGSGASIIAGKRAGAGSLLGLEVNPEFHRLAVDRFNGTT